MSMKNFKSAGKAFDILHSIGSIKSVPMSWYGSEYILESPRDSLNQSEKNTSSVDSSPSKRSPDHLFYNNVKLENNNFFPFGKRPFTNDMFYIGDEEAFSKKCTEITMTYYYVSGCEHLDSNSLQPTTVNTSKTSQSRKAKKKTTPSSNKHGSDTQDRLIVWEYSDGKTWKKIDDLDNEHDGSSGVIDTITFFVPYDINKTKVNDIETYWLRARIVSGDFGSEKYTITENGTGATKTYTYNVSNSSIKAPQISSLAVEFDKTLFKEIKHVVTYNNLEYRDYSGTKNVFKPFELFDEKKSSLFLGIDKKIKKSPISIYFDIAPDYHVHSKKPTINFYYYKGAWKKLQIDDQTDGLVKSGEVKILIPDDFAQSKRFNQTLYWIKISNSDEFLYPRKINGVFLNTTLTSNSETVSNEYVGSSNNLPNQTFGLKKIPILDEPVKVWIKEPFLLDEKDRRSLLQHQELFEIKDDQQNILEQWVLWKNTCALDNAEPKDRYFESDKVSKKIAFGNDKKGRIPPLGFNNIKVDYVSGGGQTGNLSANTISSLVNVIPFVSSVNNPLPAQGGTDKETIQHLIVRAPHSFKNQGRAITTDDYESIIQENFPSIAKSKCFPSTRIDGSLKGGYVTVVAIPVSTEKKPIADKGLLESAEKILRKRCGMMIPPENIAVIPPSYIDISISGEVYSSTIENVPVVEKKISEVLEKFLHPLYGKSNGQGWDLGDLVCLSDIYHVLKEIPEVDHVENLSISGTIDNQLVFSAKETGTQRTEIPPHTMICNGEHDLKVTK